MWRNRIPKLKITFPSEVLVSSDERPYRNLTLHNVSARRGSFCKAPSTLIRFQTKTELLCSGYGYLPHYNAENDHRKRSHSKTLSRVERFENDTVWTEKTMLSENGDVINKTRRQTTRPWVSKVADRHYHVDSLLIGVVVRTGENDTKTISVVENLFENGAKQLRFRFKTD